MGSPRQIERILAIRELEEDQGKQALELAISELAELEHGLRTATQRERAGRSLVIAGLENGEIADRIAGTEESRSSSLRAAAIKLRIRAAEELVAMLRQEYLSKRTARMQAEALAKAERSREAVIELRRTQSALDDWYLSRRQRDEKRD